MHSYTIYVRWFFFQTENKTDRSKIYIFLSTFDSGATPKTSLHQKGQTPLDTEHIYVYIYIFNTISLLYITLRYSRMCDFPLKLIAHAYCKSNQVNTYMYTGCCGYKFRFGLWCANIIYIRGLANTKDSSSRHRDPCETNDVPFSRYSASSNTIYIYRW